jgi:transposase
MAKIAKIQELHRQGLKTGMIAQKVGVSAETVRRWVNREAKPRNDVLTDRDVRAKQ